MKLEKSTSTIPFFEDGLMNEEGRLIGSKCSKCNQHAFPAQKYCPRCSNEMENCILSDKGELYSYTIVRQGPPWWKDKVPYTIGRVKLPEGVLVKAQIKNDDNVPLQIGTEMKLETHTMIDEEGKQVLIYRFSAIN